MSKFSARVIISVFFITVAQYPQFCWPDSTVHEPVGYQRFNDFLGYWTASRLLLDGENPYSAGSLLKLQRSIGLDRSIPFVAYSPPWVLTFTWPFALVDYGTGQFAWLLIQTFVVFFSAVRLWRLYGNSSASYRIAWLAALSFTPLDLAVIRGQISPLMLVGLWGFLYSEKKQASFAAGLATTLIFFKPHLLYLFWLVLVLWIWQYRQWRFALGIAAGGIAVLAVPLIIHPTVYFEYGKIWQASEVPTPYDWAVPALGHALRKIFQQSSAVLLFVPSLFGVIWLIVYWRRHRISWEWSERLPLLLLVSLCTCAYLWTFDLILLFPAVIQAASVLVRRPKPFYAYPSGQVYMAIHLLHIVMRFFITDEFWYFWMAPALLVNYLLLRKESRVLS
jgi:glycosyl transferase family 87